MSKLVRDKIPEIIRKSGKNPINHFASEEEFRTKLKEKLDEEVNEYLKNENKEELADIFEVLYAIFELNGYNKQEIEQLRRRKVKEKGRFSKRIILDK